MRQRTAPAPRGIYAAPSLLAVVAVLGIFAESNAHWTATLRPLGVAVALAALVTIVCLVLIRRRPVLAITIAGAVVLLLIGGHLAFLAIVAGGGWCVYAYWRRMHRRSAWRPPPAALVVLPTLLLAVSVASMWIDGTLALSDFAPAAQKSYASGTNQPSIYVLLLDGYPRADTLADAFDYDNRPFIDELERLGFETYLESTSPFPHSELVLLSMLSAPDAIVVDEGGAASRRALGRTPAAERLRSAGYRLVHVASPVGHTNFTGWDEHIDTGQINILETELLQNAPLGRLIGDWVISQKRERLEASMTSVVAQAARPGQKVVLAHLMAPHPPFLVEADGSPAAMLPCWSEIARCNIYSVGIESQRMTPSEYRNRFAAQLDYLNPLVVSTVRSIVTTDPEAMIVVLSDHGARHNHDDPDEWRRTLFTARTPHASGVFADNPGPSGLFMRLLEQ